MLWFLTSSSEDGIKFPPPFTHLSSVPPPEAFISLQTWLDFEGQGDKRQSLVRNAVKRTLWHERARHEQTTKVRATHKRDTLFNNNNHDKWIKAKEGRGGSAAVRGSPPSLISPAVCVVNTQQRGGPLLTKQTQWEFYFYGDLNLERENVFWDIISLHFFFFFFPLLVFYVHTCLCWFQIHCKTVPVVESATVDFLQPCSLWRESERWNSHNIFFLFIYFFVLLTVQIFLAV